jgi:hypothetical protein
MLHKLKVIIIGSCDNKRSAEEACYLFAYIQNMFQGIYGAGATAGKTFVMQRGLDQTSDCEDSHEGINDEPSDNSKKKPSKV